MSSRSGRLPHNPFPLGTSGGIGRARSGAGAAIVGDPGQVLAELRAYAGLGMEAFILSGHPHLAEGDLFARHVLSAMEHGPLSLPLSLLPLSLRPLPLPAA